VICALKIAIFQNKNRYFKRGILILQAASKCSCSFINCSVTAFTSRIRSKVYIFKKTNGLMLQVKLSRECSYLIYFQRKTRLCSLVSLIHFIVSVELVNQTVTVH